MAFPLDLERYRSVVFDCDGVLLDSNLVKTEAFRRAVGHYGHDVTEKLVEHHVTNGGISRFKKFAYFFEVLLGRAPHEGEMEDVLARFSAATKQGLVDCDEAPKLREILSSIPEDRPRLVVSGGAQDELHEVFSKRGLTPYFTAIFGSPDTKEEILSREIANGNLLEPALYIGDSRYDYLAAKACGLDFVFVSGWTEFSGWEDFCADKNIRVFESVSAIFNAST